jgi:AbrB family looped-hinge helix DNA binding protein
MPVGKHLLGLPKRHIFGTAKVGEKGQIVIPKEARKLFGIQPGDTLLLVGDEKNGIIITRPEVLNNIADQILDNLGSSENGKDEE